MGKKKGLPVFLGVVVRVPRGELGNASMKKQPRLWSDGEWWWWCRGEVLKGL